MSTYISKNPTVEARRFTRENAKAMNAWCGGRIVPSHTDGVWLTLGNHTAVPDDYIIKRGDGSFEVMSEDQFNAVYRPIGGTFNADFLLARLHHDLSIEEEPTEYAVELGGQTFSQEQWEVIEAYAKGYHIGQRLEGVNIMQEQNRRFHDVMGIVTPATPRVIPVEDVPVVIELIREEFIDELIPALGARAVFNEDGSFQNIEVTGTPNVVEIYDAAIDILYVTFGLLNRAGMDAQAGYNEVQDSNMSKLGADGLPIIAGENDPDGVFPGRVKKGPDYFKPNLAAVLREQGWQDQGLL